MRHRCRGSLPEAAVYAAGLARQQPRLLAEADALVAVSEALAERLAALGLPRERMTVLPNVVREVASESRAAEGTYALVAGRLVQDKGFDVAVRAASAARACRCGSPAPGRRRSGCGRWPTGGDVRFLGRLDAAALARERRGAAVLLAPSRSDDPCPMSVVEALADGVPVLGSDRGGLPELVGADAVLPVEDLAAWTAALRALWGDPLARAAAGAAALARIRARHAPDAYYAALMRIYGRAGGMGDGAAS